VDDSSEIQTAPSLERAEIAPAHLAFFGFAVLSMGALPSAAAGGGAFASFKPKGFWGLALHGEVLAPQRKQLGTGSLDAWLLSFGGSLCPLQGTDGAVWWSACAGMGAARLKVKSHDLLEAKSKKQWIPVPGLSARAAWRLGHGLLLGGGLEALFPVSPDRYVYRDPQGNQLPALEVSPLVISANLGLGLLWD
jgi:hypothetical protein